MENDDRITELLMRLLMSFNMDDVQIMVVALSLKTDDQRWEMSMWLNRHRGMELTFGEIFDKTESLMNI